MDLLLTIGELLLLSAPVAAAAWYLVVRGPEAMADLFRPDPGLGWPTGVQEEDPPPWRWDAAAAADGDSAIDPAPVVHRVDGGRPKLRL